MGVIRYMGETDFAKGEWCGVELDEPLGKNDGAVAGTRYTHTHTSGLVSLLAQFFNLFLHNYRRRLCQFVYKTIFILSILLLRYFQCLHKFGLFAPIHKVIRIGFPSTSPAKAKKSKRMAMGVSSLAHSPSSSSISSVSSVASSVGGRPSRAGLVRRLLPASSTSLCSWAQTDAFVQSLSTQKHPPHCHVCTRGFNPPEDVTFVNIRLVKLAAVKLYLP